MATWEHFARPGPTLTGAQRVAVLAATRRGDCASAATQIGVGTDLGRLADELFHRPADVDTPIVRAAADGSGEAATVEVVALTSMLAAVDNTHRGLGADLEPLPDPVDGAPTGEVATGLTRRRLNLPAPPGPIPVVFDLLPTVARAWQAMFGPQYMTGEQMADPAFRRDPGLDRAQIEVVASRTSLLNECFY